MIDFISIKEFLFKYKVVVANYLYVSGLNIFVLLLPLITYPYLISCLGTEKYGTLIFIQTVISYFEVISAWGFDISAVKYVAEFQKNKARLNEVVSSVVYLRLILCVVLFVVLLLGLKIFNVNDKIVYLFFYISCFSNVLFPSWFFQGIQKMKVITYFSLISKIIFTICIFIFIKKEEDYILFPLFNGLGLLIGSIFGLVLMIRVYNIRFIRVTFKFLIFRFIDSSYIFYSRIADLLIVRSNTIIVGNFLGMSEVSYYDLANKLMKLACFPMMILNQVLFPKVAQEKNFLFMKKVLKSSVFVTIVIAMFYCLMLPIGVNILGKGKMSPAIEFGYILTPIVIINSLVYLLGSPILVAAGYFKKFSNSILHSMFVYIILTLFVLIYGVSIYYILIVQILCSLTLLLSRWYYIDKYKILSNDYKR